MDIEPGAVIDRYTVLDVLGEGGMAVVYKVQHNDLDSLHALKVLTLQSSKVRERLRSEGKVQAKLRHPNIVTVTDLIDVKGAPGLVMEFIDGPGLDQLLEGPLFSIEQADALGRGIIDGVLEAHRHQLVHRDLKPGNILLHDRAGTWEPKITDFGLVKAVMANGPGLHQTRAGATMGTPAYMSPEQIRDAASVDERADLFSLGIILYQMVCGRQPFQGSDMLDVFNRISRGVFVPPREVRRDIPARMEKAILGALVTDRDSRIPDCETLKAVWEGELDDWQHERVVGAQRRGAAPSAAELLAQLQNKERPAMSGTRGPSSTLVATSSLDEDSVGPPVDLSAMPRGDTTVYPIDEMRQRALAEADLDDEDTPMPGDVPAVSAAQAPQANRTPPPPDFGAGRTVVPDSVEAAAAAVASSRPAPAPMPADDSVFDSVFDDGPPPKKSPLPMALAAGAVLLLGGGGLWASGVFSPAPAPAPAVAPAAPAPTASAPPAAAPAPAAAAPAPEPEPAAPAPAAAAPAPEPAAAAPEPKPAAPAPAAAAPAPAPAPEATPAPAPAPAASTGTVTAAGGVRVWLVGAAGRFPPGDVPPGTYTIKAFFDPMSSVDAGSITVKAGGTHTVQCSKAMGLCSVK